MINRFIDKYAFLSNMYECEIEYNGIIYPSTENAYQAQKTLSNKERLYISELTPRKSKTYSRKLDIRSDWDNIKYYIMRDLIELKFKHEYLMNMLILTSDEMIVEGNTWNDKYWGVCLKTNIGQNNLGKLLMLERDKHKKFSLFNILKVTN